MAALSNPVYVAYLGFGQRSSARVRRKEDPQRRDLYLQVFEHWSDYAWRLSEKLGGVPVRQARRIVARTRPPTYLACARAEGVVPTIESDEMRWLSENSHELTAYRGEWLLIQGRELVAHSADFRNIRVRISEQNIRSPFIYYVPTVEEADFISI